MDFKTIDAMRKEYKKISSIYNALSVAVLLFGAVVILSGCSCDGRNSFISAIVCDDFERNETPNCNQPGVVCTQ